MNDTAGIPKRSSLRHSQDRFIATCVYPGLRGGNARCGERWGHQAAGFRGQKMSNVAFDYQHVLVPLPFDMKGLNGISEKLIQSHWENNYGGAVKALNTLRSRLTQALGDPNTPPYVYTGLKREQLLRTRSVVLHEAYFGDLGGCA